MAEGRSLTIATFPGTTPKPNSQKTSTMPVVSNTSPLLNLAIIDHLFLLPQQFGQVLIPQAVLAELKVNQALPGSNALRTALNEGWLIPQSVSNKALVSLLRQELHQGESEAIALAVEVSAERILLDEKEPP